MTRKASVGIIQQIASAVDGDTDELARISKTAHISNEVARHRLAPLAAAMASESGLRGEGVETWRSALRSSAAQRLFVSSTVEAVTNALGAAQIPWMPLKGTDPIEELYRTPELRPATDADILVSRRVFDEARAALEENGWRGVSQGREAERYLKAEGYNWKAVSGHCALLELHYRLWGAVDPGLSEAILKRAEPDHSRGGSCLRTTRADAYLIAATHFWMAEPPRVLMYPFELRKMAQAWADPEFSEEICERAIEHDLQVFVGLSAQLVWDLWRCETGRAVFERLSATFRSGERFLLRRAMRTTLAALHIPLPAIVAARLFDRRRSRTGWRGPIRRIWPHPGVLEEMMPDTGSGLKRRLLHLSGWA
jgi:hypothetical protein